MIGDGFITQKSNSVLKVEYHGAIGEDNQHPCSDHSPWIRSILRTSLLFQWWSTSIAAVFKLSWSIGFRHCLRYAIRQSSLESLTNSKIR